MYSHPRIPDPTTTEAIIMGNPDRRQTALAAAMWRVQRYVLANCCRIQPRLVGSVSETIGAMETIEDAGLPVVEHPHPVAGLELRHQITTDRIAPAMIRMTIAA